MNCEALFSRRRFCASRQGFAHGSRDDGGLPYAARSLLHFDTMMPESVVSRHARSLAFADRPLLAIWEVTQACDLACVHCRANATCFSDAAELTTDEGKQLIESIAATGTALLVLTGGDPAKRQDLPELIAHAAVRGLTVAVTPSGTALTTRDVLAQWRDAGMSRLAVSVDGADHETHDRFRRVDGSFAHSLRILHEALDLGIPRQVNTTLGPHNRRSLREMAALVHQAGAALWSVFVVVPTGRATLDLMLDARQLEHDLLQLVQLLDEVPFDIKTSAAPQFRRILLQRKRDPLGLLRDVDAQGNVLGMRGMNDGVGLVFISHRGDIFPSGFLPVTQGNVRVDDLATVYRSAPLFRAARDVHALEGKCGVCPFKIVCGGSRSRAYALRGSIHASDPLCAYVPKRWADRTNSNQEDCS